MEKFKLLRLFGSLSGIPLAEFLAKLPSVDEFTTWIKLLLQLILLITALLQAQGLWLERRKRQKQ